MTELSWFPVNCDFWTQKLRGMSAEAVGVFFRLALYSWRDPIPCTIADSPDELSSALGAKWKSLLPLVANHFVLSDGRYRCAWLLEMHGKQTALHTKRSVAGKEGGKRKAKAQANDVANLEANAEAKTKDTPSFEKEEDRLKHGLTANALALSPTAATRAALTGALAESGVPSIARPATGDELAEAVRDTAPPPRSGAELTAAERKIIDQRTELPGFPLADYQQGLNRAVAKWCMDNPDAATEIRERVEVQEADALGESVPRSVLDRSVERVMREEIRVLNGWPEYEGWIVATRRKAERSATAA